MKSSFVNKQHGCLICGYLSLLKLFLLLIVSYFGIVFFIFQYMKWNFNTNGGSTIFRDSCIELKLALLESSWGDLLFDELNLPPENPLHKLNPKIISLKKFKDEKNIYRNGYAIGITSGMYHTGYIIFESADDFPKRIFFGPNREPIIKNIGDGVYIYQWWR